MPEDGDGEADKVDGHRFQGQHSGGGFKQRRAYCKHVLRGELQATAHTSWWYAVSGANKLSARTLASRQRYKVEVSKLTDLVKRRLNLKDGVKSVNFHNIVSAKPSAKVSSLADVEEHIKFIVETHDIRSKFIYRKTHVR